MFGIKNPTITEKPDHAHYPACRGRLEAIEKNGFRLFKYTLVVSFWLAVISFLGNPVQVIGWIPILVCGSYDYLPLSGCCIQVILCIGLALMALLGCGKRKVLHFVLLMIYAAMFLSCIVYRYTVFDIFTFIIGGMGVVFGYNAYADYFDYKQLSETEGFPMFSLILVEHEARKEEQKKFEEWYASRQHSNSTKNSQSPGPQAIPLTGINKAPVQQTVKNPNPTEGLGDMPEITVRRKLNSSAPEDIFKPRSGKASRIADSKLKFR